jgi:hypothetical protein
VSSCEETWCLTKWNNGKIKLHACVQ